MDACPICREALEEPLNTRDYGDKLFVNCPICGMFGITRSALSRFDKAVSGKPSLIFLISHFLRTGFARATPTSLDTPVLDLQYFDAVLEFLVPPTLREQASNLVRWLGDLLRESDPAAQMQLRLNEAAS